MLIISIDFYSLEAFEEASRRIVTLTMRMPQKFDGPTSEIAKSLVRIPLILIDTICAARGNLSGDTRAKIKKARDELKKGFIKAEEEKRLEELRKRKVEAKKAELAALSPKERAKREEKDALVEQKRKQKGSKQKVVMA
jgi:hypothetical protein